MTDLLGPLTSQLVGHRDESTESVLLTGWSSGPAGLATVTMGGGRIELSLDYAEPTTVSQIVIVGPSDDPTDDRGGAPVVADALEVLLGACWSTVASRLTAEPAIVWRADDGPTYRVDGGRIAGALSRLAVLEAEATERPWSPAGLAVADVERAVVAGELPAALALADRPGVLMARGGGRLLDIGWSEIRDHLDWRGRLGLAALLTRGVPLLGDEDPYGLAGHLQKLSSLLRGDAPAAAGQAAAMPAAAMAPPPMAPAAAPMAEDRLYEVADADADGAGEQVRSLRAKAAAAVGRSIAVDVDPAVDAEVVRTDVVDDHLEVVVRPGDGRDLWLRLFRRDHPPVLLELAPLRSNDFGSAVATVLLPRTGPGSGLDHGLAADLTDDPRQRWLAPAVRVTRRSVRQGRDACRAERAGDTDAAAERWQQSADGWETAGDPRRAALARQYADGQSPPPARAADPGRIPTGREPLAPFVLDHHDR